MLFGAIDLAPGVLALFVFLPPEFQKPIIFFNFNFLDEIFAQYRIFT